MKLAFLAVVSLAVAGCAGAKDLEGNSINPCLDREVGLPALCFGVDYQAHQLVVLGGECCLAQWGNLSIGVSGDPACGLEAPAQGPIVAGQRATVLGGGELDCTLKVAYDGIVLGLWDLGPKARQDAQEAQEAQTRTWTAGDAV